MEYFTMGHWFNEFRDDKGWRKTPAKINGKWYTQKGELINDPKAYFSAVNKNGRYWEKDTGWTKGNKKRK